MKTLSLNTYENYLLWFAVVHAPLDGLRISDLPKLEEAKKLFVHEEPINGERQVEVSAELLRYLRATWDALPVGKLARTDDLPIAVKSITEKLKD